jgi:hypothetical protein
MPIYWRSNIFLEKQVCAKTRINKGALMNKMLLAVCLIASTFSANLALAKIDYSQFPFPNKCEEVTSLVRVNETNRVLCRQSAIMYGLDNGLIKTK